MSLKQKVEKLEEQTRAAAERKSGMVEMLMTWPGEEPRVIMVPPSTIEMINKIYGPEGERLRRERAGLE